LRPALEHLAETDEPVARLLSAVTALSERFDAERDRVPGLLEVFVHAARDPAARGPIVEIWADVRTRLAGVIVELRAHDAIPAWVEPRAMASLVVAVVAGTVVNETVDPTGVGHREVAAQFANLLVNARSA
jgi:hypothetical protein